MSVCLFTYLKNHVLTATVARCLFDENAIRYILSVLRMTDYLMGPVAIQIMIGLIAYNYSNLFSTGGAGVKLPSPVPIGYYILRPRGVMMSLSMQSTIACKYLKTCYYVYVSRGTSGLNADHVQHAI